MAAYYPRRVAKFSDLQKAYPGFETYDDFEEDRIESVAITKSRGKGAPKKKRTAAGKWEQRTRKRHLLIVLQNQRSLARRRGKHCTEDCLAVYPTRAKARACKNTHRYMGCKSKEGSIGITKKEAFHGVIPRGFHITYLATRNARLVQKFNLQPSHFHTPRNCVSSVLLCGKCSSICCCRVFFFSTNATYKAATSKRRRLSPQGS